MTNETYLDDAGLGFGAVASGEVIRWSDCGGSEILARGGQDEIDEVERVLRSDARLLPGDPEDDSDERGLIAFWSRVNEAVRRVCGQEIE